jgi:hypothetical protein
MVQTIKLGEHSLFRYEVEHTFEVRNIYNTIRIVYEPGDATRYDFYAIDVGYAYLLASEGSINYPRKIEKYLLDGNNEEEAVKIILNEYREWVDINPYTVWATVSALIKLKEYV